MCLLQISAMSSLVENAQKKVKEYEETSNNLQNALTELENQRYDAKSYIQETFQVNKYYMCKSFNQYVRLPTL